MGIWASVLLDPVLLLLALLLLPVELTTLLKGRWFLNAAECPGPICPHLFGVRVLAVLPPPSATVPETVPLVVLCKVSTLVFLQVLMEGLARPTAKALEVETIRAVIPVEGSGLLLAFRRTLRILKSAVGTFLHLVDQLPLLSCCTLGLKCERLNGL